jgi:asparagine synthetase B (glutamine-hydrolysing)
MMISGSQFANGDFTIFGFTRNPHFIEQQLRSGLRINPKTFQIGTLGHLFFYTSYGDVAESEEALVLKLGFLRSKTKSPLTAQQLLEEKLVGPRLIDTEGFSGNGLVVGLSKKAPVFSVFETLMAVPQLYYHQWDEGIICSDVLRILTKVIPKCELNEVILPQHFLFRSVYGSSTYYQGVERVIPGQYLKWTESNTDIRQVRSLDVISTEADYIRDDGIALNLLYESLLDVVGDYVRQVEMNNQELSTLLSGGVDSTLVQYLINANATQKPTRSISYAIQVPAFKFEIEYAQQASQLLQTEHTFVKYTPEDYPGLLIRAIEILAQPTNLETEPSMLAIAEYVHAAGWPEKYFFTGLAADSLMGNKESQKLKGIQYISRFPFIIPLLKGLGSFFSAKPSWSHTLMKGAKIIESKDDQDDYISPANFFHVFVFNQDWEVMRSSFGDEQLKEALAFRRSQSEFYSSSQHYLDKIHFIDLFTETYDIAAQRQQLFLAHNLFQVDPFSDEDLIKAMFTIHPDIRYMKGFKSKYLLKRLFTQKINAKNANQPKGGSTTPEDLVTRMRTGSLRPLIEEIERPAFMSQKDFDGVIQRSNYFLWNLLTFDLFNKRIVAIQNKKI